MTTITTTEANLHKASNERINKVIESATYNVVITYSGFCVDQHGTSQTREVKNTAPFKVLEFGNVDDLLNRLYHETNIHQGRAYDALVDTGYEGRITMSVGDIVTVNWKRYIVCEIGFACIDNIF
jgi:hypothetical protein